MSEYKTLQDCIKLMRDAKYQCTIQQPSEGSFIIADAIRILSEIDLVHRKWFNVTFMQGPLKITKIVDAANDIELNTKLNILCSELKEMEVVSIVMM